MNVFCGWYHNCESCGIRILLNNFLTFLFFFSRNSFSPRKFKWSSRNCRHGRTHRCIANGSMVFDFSYPCSVWDPRFSKSMELGGQIFCFWHILLYIIHYTSFFPFFYTFLSVFLTLLFPIGFSWKIWHENSAISTTRSTISISGSQRGNIKKKV